MINWICFFIGHRWEWYLPNYEGTIIGTQICKRCNEMRGVSHDQFSFCALYFVFCVLCFVLSGYDTTTFGV